jgi:hypothetical protein
LLSAVAVVAILKLCEAVRLSSERSKEKSATLLDVFVEHLDLFAELKTADTTHLHESSSSPR